MAVKDKKLQVGQHCHRQHFHPKYPNNLFPVVSTDFVRRAPISPRNKGAVLYQPNRLLRHAIWGCGVSLRWLLHPPNSDRGQYQPCSRSGQVPLSIDVFHGSRLRFENHKRICAREFWAAKPDQNVDAYADSDVPPHCDCILSENIQAKDYARFAGCRIRLESHPPCFVYSEIVLCFGLERFHRH